MINDICFRISGAVRIPHKEGFQHPATRRRVCMVSDLSVRSSSGSGGCCSNCDSNSNSNKSLLFIKTHVHTIKCFIRHIDSLFQKYTPQYEFIIRVYVFACLSLSPVCTSFLDLDHLGSRLRAYHQAICLVLLRRWSWIGHC